MYKQLKNNEGFTIIEIMIVLAIAALILIIVLLAVPALQRGSKSTTIKNDASSIAGGINDYTGNNNGTGPTSVTGNGGVVSISGSGPTSKVNVSPTANVQGLDQSNGFASAAALTQVLKTPGEIVTVYGITCGVVNNSAVQSVGTVEPTSYAVYYSTDSGNGWVAGGCIQA